MLRSVNLYFYYYNTYHYVLQQHIFIYLFALKYFCFSLWVTLRIKFNSLWMFSPFMAGTEIKLNKFLFYVDLIHIYLLRIRHFDILCPFCMIYISWCHIAWTFQGIFMSFVISVFFYVLNQFKYLYTVRNILKSTNLTIICPNKFLQGDIFRNIQAN